jgi:hypothetical protein
MLHQERNVWFQRRDEEAEKLRLVREQEFRLRCERDGTPYRDPELGLDVVPA